VQGVFEGDDARRENGTDGSSNSGLYISNGGLSKEYAFQWSYGIPEDIDLAGAGVFWRGIPGPGDHG